MIRRAALLVACGSSLAFAQTIRGTVVDQTNRPVSGVLVLMLDSASNQVARSLSNERGEFRVASGQGAGSYRLRTLRIGFKPTLSDPIALFLGGEVERNVSLTGAQFALDTIRVFDKSSCRIQSDAAAAATFAVWEQARAALTAAQLTAAGRNVMATTLSYERVLDPEGRRVLKQDTKLQTAYVTQPWKVTAPDALHRLGFVVLERDNSTTYYAPSMEVLTSNVFLEDHCFKLVNEKRQPTMLGLAFEPSGDRKRVPEIKGTLWVDKKTSELKRLDYRYVNLSQEQENAGAGGELEFARMSNGGWAITRWNIRMPVFEQVIRTANMGGNAVHLGEIQVTGGELVLATRQRAPGLDTLWSRPALSLNGTVVDSASGKAIVGAYVSLSGTAIYGQSDDRGRFRIDGVLPGNYTLETRTPSLDAIGAVNTTLVSFSDSTANIQVRVASAEQLVNALCKRQLDPGTGMIVGRAYSRGDTAARGTTVVADWIDPNVADRQGRRMTVKADDQGTFRMCGVPTGYAVTLTASTESAQSPPTEIKFGSARSIRADLAMTLNAGTTFAGMVLDSAKKPIIAAEVSFPELSRSVMTDGSGAFRIGELPAGTHKLTVRRLGYGPLEASVPFDGKRGVERTIYLARSAQLDTVYVTDTRPDELMKEFEANRRIGVGRFLTRADLAKQEFRKLSDVMSEMPGAAVVRGQNGRGWLYSSRNDPCFYPINPLCRPGGNAYAPDEIEARQGMQLRCYALVYLDGILMTPGKPPIPFDIASIPVSMVESIEYYAGGATVPMRYQGKGAECGLMIIHTRRKP